MLKRLKIRNYAIIRESELQFHSGLTIITGETGAGKSILMGALGLILGERADTKVLFQGSDKCVVEAEFDISNYKLSGFFAEHDLDEEPTCILRRELTAAGKTRAFINDTPVNLPVMKALGSHLVDIVSQHETLELNEAGFQLEVLDAIAGNSNDLETFQQLYRHQQALNKQLESLLERESRARQDEDYFRFVLNELDELDPKPGEQEILEQELDRLSHADSIMNGSAQAAAMLNESENSVADQIREIKNMLSAPARHHAGLQQLLDRLSGNLLDLEDIAAELQQLAGKTMVDPDALQQTELRLQQLFAAQKKHRVQTADELIALRENFRAQFNDLGSLQDQIQEVQTALEAAGKELHKQGLKLRKRRQSVLDSVNERVNQLLAQVAMPNAHFEVQLTELPAEKASLSGMDQVMFLFSANKGFALQPISKVASGGELSRLMLCIKSLIADQVHLPTVIFDEIDTGISGEAAQKVAGVLRNHASAHQVIAITHLPQIAGKADLHLYVYKTTEHNTTTTDIRTLQPKEQVEEIARMLSGENPSEKVLAAARELIGK